MGVRPQHAMLAAYSVAHLLVDLSGIYFLSIRVYPIAYTDKGGFAWLSLVVLYNFLAFALPAIMGLLADLSRQSTRFAALGCFLVCIGYLCAPTGLSEAWPILLIGMGNGIFHIGGGIDILEGWPKRYAPSGIFISTGAIGVFLGRRAGLLPSATAWFLTAAMGLLCALLYCLAPRWRKARVEAGGVERPILPPPCKRFAAAVLALFLVVCLRSYYGTILKYPWAVSLRMGTASMLCLVAGKMAGGLLADRIGVLQCVGWSLGASAILAPFSFLPYGDGAAALAGFPLSAICGLLAIFCFNMTMPLTLVLLARLFGHAKGLAFGLLTFALFLGTLPSLISASAAAQASRGLRPMDWQPALFSPLGICLLCLASLILLLVACRLIGGEEGRRTNRLERGRP